MIKNKPKIPNQEQSAESFREEKISVTDIILILVQQLKIILITPIIFCTLAIYYALFMTVPVYTSTAKIMSASGRSGSSQALGIAAQFGIAIPSGLSDKQWVYSEIMKSRTLARAMLKRKFDTKMYGPQKSLLHILTYGNESPSVGLDTLVKYGINGVIDMISIGENGIFYDLSISAPEPVFARDFAIALIEELDAPREIAILLL
jgi:capsule polysaccharide export protein KpsE/RkpR